MTDSIHSDELKGTLYGPNESITLLPAYFGADGLDLITELTKKA